MFRFPGSPAALFGQRPSLLVTFVILWLASVIASPTLQAQVYTDLHEFNCAVEGCIPTYPELLAQGRDGNLYGTTNEGGPSDMGTVFKATTAGVITTIYNFSGADGQNPNSGLTIGPDGNFYGTTRVGGAANMGTVFKITATGVLTTLHSFTNTGDGENPLGAPTLGKNGNYYGTTCSQSGPWTAYTVTPTGGFTTLTGSVPPCPYDPFILGSDGNFYGTSQVGGTTYQGTVFRMTPTGAITVVHSFSYTDGAYLYSPLVQGKDGLLYGTTSGGGTPQGGVIFKVSTGGVYSILHQFDSTGGTDGSTPFSGLVAASDGNFYGATSSGTNSGSVPNGALFEINSNDQKYSNLYAFDGTHGSLEDATPMQHTNGKIYGLTERGGFYQGGVLFSLDNSLKPFVTLVPAFAGTGKSVGIFGQGFTGTTSVKFGTVAATFHVVSDTYLATVVPANAASGLVTVTTPSGTLTSKFQIHVVPAITGISPTTGPVGTVVTIAGTGLTGATQVTFGNVAATSFTVNSAAKITATVPASAVTGKVGVRTPGGTATSSATFTVTP